MNDIFKTIEYKVLEFMHDNVVKIKDETFCPLGQSDISDALHISRATVNRIFKTLQNEGCIRMLARGKWVLSENSIKMISVTKKI